MPGTLETAAAGYNEFVRRQAEVEKGDSEVLGMIDSGKYNSVQKGDSVVNWCNVFTDDVAKKKGVKLPRIKELPGFGGKGSEDWPENPASAQSLAGFFRAASEMPASGVKRVDPAYGKELANEGEFVIFSGEGHSTVMAPTKKWPNVYRSDIGNRGEDTRRKVGVSAFAPLYHIDKDKFNERRSELIRDFNKIPRDKYGYEMAPVTDGATRAHYERMTREMMREFHEVAPEMGI